MVVVIRTTLSFGGPLSKLTLTLFQKLKSCPNCFKGGGRGDNLGKVRKKRRFFLDSFPNDHDAGSHDMER